MLTRLQKQLRAGWRCMQPQLLEHAYVMIVLSTGFISTWPSRCWKAEQRIYNESNLN